MPLSKICCINCVVYNLCILVFFPVVFYIFCFVGIICLFPGSFSYCNKYFNHYRQWHCIIYSFVNHYQLRILVYSSYRYRWVCFVWGVYWLFLCCSFLLFLSCCQCNSRWFLLYFCCISCSDWLMGDVCVWVERIISVRLF